MADLLNGRAEVFWPDGLVWNVTRCVVAAGEVCFGSCRMCPACWVLTVLMRDSETIIRWKKRSWGRRVVFVGMAQASRADGDFHFGRCRRLQYQDEQRNAMRNTEASQG